MDAAASFAVDRSRGIHWHDAPPVVVRPTGADRVHLVHTAGGPLGGDRLRLDGTVGTGCALTVASAGATVVQPGPHDETATWTVRLDVAAGACLSWAPQPTVVCADADFRAALHATIADDGALFVREVLVLGRSDETGGRHAGGVYVSVGGEPLLCHENLMDGADAALSGPAGSGGHRVHGMALAVGSAVRPVDERAGCTGAVSWAVLPLDGPGHLVLAVGARVTEVAAVLDHLAAQTVSSTAPADNLIHAGQVTTAAGAGCGR